MNLTNEDLKYLKRKGINLDIAKEYNNRFLPQEILELYEKSCFPNYANQFKYISHISIIKLKSLNLDTSILKNTKSKNMESYLEQIISIFEQSNGRNNIKILGTGASGIILNVDRYAWKYSDEMRKEENFLKNIAKNSKNIEPKFVSVISKENLDIKTKIKPLYLKIAGKYTLQDFINVEVKFTENQTLDLIKNLLNSLIEMRTGGIFYHRDIRPANIIYTQKGIRLIDFGIATTNPDSQQICNRRYGSVNFANDYISIAQVAYKMFTGFHLFAKSKSMDETLEANNILDERELFFQDSKKLNKKSIEIQKKTPRKLSELIFSLLNSNPHDNPEEYLKKIPKISINFFERGNINGRGKSYNYIRYPKFLK